MSAAERKPRCDPLNVRLPAAVRHEFRARCVRAGITMKQAIGAFVEAYSSGKAPIPARQPAAGAIGGVKTVQLNVALPSALLRRFCACCGRDGVGVAEPVVRFVQAVAVGKADLAPASRSHVERPGHPKRLTEVQMNVRVSETVHTRFRVRCASEGASMKAVVQALVAGYAAGSLSLPKLPASPAR